MKTRQNLHDELLNDGYEVVDMAAMMAKKTMAARLQSNIELVKKTKDFNEMLLAVLGLYNHASEVRSRVGLKEDWHGSAVWDYQELGQQVKGVVERALAMPRMLSSGAQGAAKSS